MKAYFGMSQQNSISSLLLGPWNPAGVGLRPQGCSKAKRKQLCRKGKQLSLTEGVLVLPSWVSIHSEDAVSPGLSSFFSRVRSPWGGRHRSPGGQSYLITVHSHEKQKQAPNAIAALILQFCVPQFILISTERQHERSLQALLTYSGSRNNFILTWNKKKNTDKATKHRLQLQFRSPGSWAGTALKVYTEVWWLNFSHWQEWKKVVSTS